MTEVEPVENTEAAAPANRIPLFLAIGLVVLGLIIICVAGYFLFRDTDDGLPVLGQSASPTPFALGSGDCQALVAADVGEAEPVNLTLSVPGTLMVGGKSFNVQIDTVDPAGTWMPALADENTAAWACGSVVNYVLGISSSNDNRRVLESLAPGDEIRLVMRNGAQYVFVVTAREIVPSNQSDVFRQTNPGVTVVMIGSGGADRLVVRGNYQLTEGGATGDTTTPGAVVQLGETAQLGDIRLTANGATSVFDRPEIPPGFMFFLISYQVQNTGGLPIDATALRLELRDEFGNQYALNQAASQLGNAPPLQGPLNPGEVREAVAGYQLPAGLASPALLWVISRTDVPGSQVQVNIPFATGAEEGSANFVVAPQSAEVSLDGTSVTVLGQLTNTGAQPLVVEEQDVTLVSEGTHYLKLFTNPSFPWVVPPGQTITFSVAFQRPLMPEAVFTVSGQPFMLTGLR